MDISQFKNLKKKSSLISGTTSNGCIELYAMNWKVKLRRAGYLIVRTLILCFKKSILCGIQSLARNKLTF